MTDDEKILEAFYGIITDSKREMFERIAAERTKYLTVVMENIRKEHNASAVLRTCDCFGVQELHAIEKGRDYVIQREIARGAGSWVDLLSHSTGDEPELECLRALRKKGYRIVATSPHAEMDIYSLPIDRPLALVFGNEKKGISRTIEREADYLVRIPMYGFTESYNISVSVAICLNILRKRLENSDIIWKLSHDEQVQLKIDWSTKIIREGQQVEKEFRKRILEKE